ncbi:porin [Rhodoferax fermentans]|uniref:Porin domain-containing protein n=1 Tax=Rhodoferax fermentans TaxID=28066 RepID=A0A1T1ATN4_RHOFE|nr:porin [Rhodoferax fermentans]MBK1683037.1 porin [Rhodoferax fermentans]OOV07469.1 hypothetical protein RF819_12690 [Rhodoferax fermentans]
MKKSLIALAVLAASGAAMAQSSVTVYGIADVWFGSAKSTVGGVSVRDTLLESGGVNSSRWGIKGSEDLGGGLKANFVLEQGFNLDDGSSKDLATKLNGDDATGSAAFSRQSYVGFSGGFGEVKLGKMWTAYDDVNGASDAVFDSKLSPMNWIFASTGYNSNPGNSIYYATPTFGGFAGAVSYSLGEDKTTTLSASSIASYNLTYAAGPLAVQFGYQVEDNNTFANDAKFTRLGATYDFGIAKLYATYGKVTNVGHDTTFDAKEYQIGVDYPVTSALTLSASYAKSDDDRSNGAFEESRKGYGIGASYTLSKRTFLYGGYTSNKFTNNGTADDKLNILAVGVQHRF